MKELNGHTLIGDTWDLTTGFHVKIVAHNWRRVEFAGADILRIGKIRWLGSATIRLVFDVPPIGLIQIVIGQQDPKTQTILKRISKRIPASRNMGGDPYGIRWETEGDK